MKLSQADFFWSSPLLDFFLEAQDGHGKAAAPLLRCPEVGHEEGVLGGEVEPVAAGHVIGAHGQAKGGVQAVLGQDL